MIIDYWGPKCTKCKREATAFAFRDRKLVYACNHHRTVIQKDQIIDWMRIAKLSREKS